MTQHGAQHEHGEGLKTADILQTRTAQCVVHLQNWYHTNVDDSDKRKANRTNDESKNKHRKDAFVLTVKYKHR